MPPTSSSSFDIGTQEQGPDARLIDRRDRQWVAIQVRAVFTHVGNVYGFAGLREDRKRAVWVGMDRGTAPPLHTSELVLSTNVGPFLLFNCLIKKMILLALNYDFMKKLITFF